MAREAIARVADGRPQLGAGEANARGGPDGALPPGAPLGWLVGAGASAVAAELAREAAPA